MMATLNAIKSIASCACLASAVADFYIKPCTGIGRRFESVWDALPVEANSGTTCSTIPERGRGRPPGCASETAAVTEAMATVNTTTPKTGNTSPIARQQAIENALSMALFHVRHGITHAAVGRAIRAASMMKQACVEIATSGRAA